MRVLFKHFIIYLIKENPSYKFQQKQARNYIVAIIVNRVIVFVS